MKWQCSTAFLSKHKVSDRGGSLDLAPRMHQGLCEDSGCPSQPHLERKGPPSCRHLSMASKIQFGGQWVMSGSHWKAQIPWASNPLPSGAHLNPQLWEPPNLPWNLRSWDLMILQYTEANNSFNLRSWRLLRSKFSLQPARTQHSWVVMRYQLAHLLLKDPWKRHPSICWGKPLKYLKFCTWGTWVPLRLPQVPLPPEGRNPQRPLPNEADSPRKNRWFARGSHWCICYGGSWSNCIKPPNSNSFNPTQPHSQVDLPGALAIRQDKHLAK